MIGNQLYLRSELFFANRVKWIYKVQGYAAFGNKCLLSSALRLTQWRVYFWASLWSASVVITYNTTWIGKQTILCFCILHLAEELPLVIKQLVIIVLFFCFNRAYLVLTQQEFENILGKFFDDPVHSRRDVQCLVFDYFFVNSVQQW